MNKIKFNTEPTTIPAPTKPDVSPDTKPGVNPDKGNDPWSVPSPSVNPTPKA